MENPKDNDWYGQQLVSNEVPLIDPATGLISNEWYRFFFNLYTLTGSGRNAISLTDLQLGPPSTD